MGTRPFLPRRAALDGAPAPANVRTTSIAAGRRGREAAALLLFAASVFLCLALASARFDPNDPTVTGPDWVGPVGAAIATFLIQGFGLVSWLVPLELALIGKPLIRGRPVDQLAVRIFGDLIVFIIVASLLQVAFPNWCVMGRAPAGGNVGLLFGELMRGMFSAAGSFLVGSTSVLLILIGRSSFSFIRFCDRVLELARLFAAAMRRVYVRLSDAWAEARELRAQRLDEARARALPKIDTSHSDEAIIMQLEEDDGDWIPFEATGAPPLAISEALKQARSAPASVLGSDDAPADPQPTTEPPAADESPAPSPGHEVAPVASRSRKSAAAARAPAGPVIVDTKPKQEVERAKGLSKRRKSGNFELPPTDLLATPVEDRVDVNRDAILEHAQLLEKTLADYGVSAKVEEIHPGPTVTTYEVAPEAGTKVSKVANLSDDLALGLSRKVRIIAPIPGKSRIGFELPNDERIPVNLRELIEDKRFEKLGEKAPLPVVLGRDIVGAPFYADLASMPHVIVAGATGAGKSVGLNVMLSSLLFRRTPEELRLLMIDPKVVELAPFDGIPHMLHPVVTDMKQAATALRWAVDEMERRYQLFANAGTKNITTYNNWVARVLAGEVKPPAPEEVEAMTVDGAVVSVPVTKHGSDGQPLPGKLPYIVLVVDEFADLMMQQGKEVESSVARLAQKARAAGMHVVLATQRPSVDVITGMIKANFPSRIAYRVAQKVDSRTILDEQGAEVLLGKGDMLVKLNGRTDTLRVQCPFVSEEEVAALTDYLREQGTPEYCEAIVQESEAEDVSDQDMGKLDSRFDEAVLIVRETQRCSTSWLQRKMTIGYNRAAKIVEMMEKQGLVGPPNGARDREVFIPPG